MLIVAGLTSTPALGQESISQGQPTQSDPVSVKRIRAALERLPAQAPTLLDERPNFRIEIRERQRVDELLQSLKIDNGPRVPGGLYAYDQQLALFPKLDSPGRFTPVGGVNLLPAGRAIAGAISNLRRARAEKAAHEEVQRALDEFWAAQGKAPPDKK